MEKNSKTKKYKLIGSLLIMCLIVVLFNHAMYWTEYSTWFNKMLVLFISLFSVIGVPCILTFVRPVSDYIDRFVDNKKKQFKSIIDNPQKTLIYILFLVVLVIASFFVNRILYAGSKDKNITQYFFSGCALLIFFVCVFRKYAYKRAEVLFAGIALIMGITFVFISPRNLLVTWDDETHYIRAESIADIFDNTKYSAEQAFYESQPASYWYSVGEMTDEEFQNVFDNIEQIYSDKNIEERFTSSIGIEFMAYIPAATGTILGRALGLSFIHTFMLAKIMNLISYVVVMYFAIKTLRYGKILLSVTGLMGTTMFMASTYSYDFWVISFFTLGFCMFISELQYREKKLTYGRIITMNVIFAVALMPKAIYFVAMFALLFMPKDKFIDKKQRMWYFIVIIGIAILLMLSFVAPMLINTDQRTDSRGGDNISSAGQIAFIFGNPVQYTHILIKFMMEYLSLENAGDYVNFMAYMGNGYGETLTLVLLGILSFIDRGEERVSIPAIRIAYFFSALACIALIATALYISYTPVGYDTVSGCQQRYLLPLLFPTLYFIGVDGIKISINKNVMAIISMGIMSVLFMSSIFSMCI